MRGIVGLRLPIWDIKGVVLGGEEVSRVHLEEVVAEEVVVFIMITLLRNPNLIGTKEKPEVTREVEEEREAEVEGTEENLI